MSARSTPPKRVMMRSTTRPRPPDAFRRPGRNRHNLCKDRETNENSLHSVRHNEESEQLAPMTDLPTIVLFRRPTGFGNVPESKDLPSQSQCSAEYYRARERAERAAASRARSPAA